MVQAQLNKAGFKIELKIPELGQFVQDWRNSNFDAFVSTNAGAVDPDDTFYRTFRTGGSTNVFKYSNADLDKLLDSARIEADPAARRASYNQIQQTLACNGPIAFMTYGSCLRPCAAMSPASTSSPPVVVLAGQHGPAALTA